MGTQNPDLPPINFSINRALTSVRLLEAPDEVLDIITNGQPLKFKSAPAQNDHDGGSNDGKEGFLHLCSNDKAWAVKQVSTSNSVYIVQPTDRKSAALAGAEHGQNSNDDGDVMEVDVTGEGIGTITAFAKPTNILELYKIPPESYEVVVTEHLRKMLPCYSLVRYESNAVPKKSREHAVSFEDIYNDIPAPDAAIRRVSARLGVFEMKKNGACYIPSESTLLATWKKVVDAATIAGTQLSRMTATGVVKLLEQDDDDSDTATATAAIAQAMFAANGMFDVLGLRDTSLSSAENPVFNEMDTARWVGNLRLAQDKTATLAADAFISRWEDLVPAAWIKYCSVEVLGHACEVVTKSSNNDNNKGLIGDDGTGTETVRWKPFVTSAATVGDSASASTRNDNAAALSAASGSAAKPATATAIGKRKWHEKFAAQRNDSSNNKK